MIIIVPYSGYVWLPRDGPDIGRCQNLLASIIRVGMFCQYIASAGFDVLK